MSSTSFNSPDDFLPHIYSPLGYTLLNDAKEAFCASWSIDPIADKSRLATYLFSGGAIGIVLGPASGNLFCIDLDDFTDEMYAIADKILPRTSCMAGRAGDFIRHRFYEIAPEDFTDDVLPGKGSAIRKFMDEGKCPRFPGTRHLKGIYGGQKWGIDVLGAGAQVGAPPSIYRQDGDKIIRREWHGGSPSAPTRIKYSVLLAAVMLLYAALGGKPKTIKSPVPKITPHSAQQGTAMTAADLPSDFAGYHAAMQKSPPAISGQGGNSTTFAVCCLAGDYNVPIEQAWPMLQEYNRTCDPAWEEAELYVKLQNSYEARKLPIGCKVNRNQNGVYTMDNQKKIADGNIIYLPAKKDAEANEAPKEYGADPIQNAQLYMEHRHNGTLRYFDGGYYAFNGKYYAEITKDEITGEFERAFIQITIPTSDGFRKLKRPEINKAFESLTKLASRKSLFPPIYLNGKTYAEHMLVLQNGTINLMITGLSMVPSLEPFDSNLFTTSMLNYDYDPKAPYSEWEVALKKYTGDEKAVLLLQEYVGYCLTCRTDLQKILVILGSSRSGKGTFSRIIRQVLASVRTTSLNTLSNDFGVAPLIGKRLAIIEDIQQIDQKKRDNAKEILLNISGEDQVAINQKHREILDRKLFCKLLLIGNKFPSFIDNANALRNRLMFVSFPNSFAGKEDPSFEIKLASNLSGILNWAIAGLCRLNANGGKFTVCESGIEYLEQFTATSNPTSQFIKECCVYPAGEEHSTISEDLYRAYQGYSRGAGRSPLTQSHFFADLKANAAQIRHGQRRSPEQDQRPRVYYNIQLSDKGQQMVQMFPALPTTP